MFHKGLVEVAVVFFSWEEWSIGSEFEEFENSGISRIVCVIQRLVGTRCCFFFWGGEVQILEFEDSRGQDLGFENLDIFEISKAFNSFFIYL